MTPAAHERERGSEPEPSHGHQPPLLPAQLTELLEQVVYLQVLEHVDLGGLFELEQQLTLIAGNLPGISPDQASHTARTLIDHALRRVPDSARNYLRIADCLGGDTAAGADNAGADNTDGADDGGADNADADNADADNADADADNADAADAGGADNADADDAGSDNADDDAGADNADAGANNADGDGDDAADGDDADDGGDNGGDNALSGNVIGRQPATRDNS
ncbi:MAG TPA: hypothetical protein VH165_06310 [Kofleriaceae bacterium]|nr:hypothetical protein [Kofleriaceae bacterium]